MSWEQKSHVDLIATFYLIWLAIVHLDYLKLCFFLFQGPACARSAYQDHRSQGKDRGCVQEEVSHHLQTTARANRVVFPPGSAYIRTIVDLQIYQHFR